MMAQSQSVSLLQARSIADTIITQMCSSIAVHRITRAERMQRLRLAQSIVDKVDADPHAARLSPREWRLVYDTLRAQEQEEADLMRDDDQEEE